ncbi:hypothetical protein RYX36_025909 [Vicia faba]
MENGPAPFSEIGKRARDLLYKDYNFHHKFTLFVPISSGLGLTATGFKKDQYFVGDINSLYKSGNVTVDVKVYTYSNVYTKVTLNNVFHSKKVALSFNVPDHKLGKLDVQYLHPHATFDSSIGLNPAPQLKLSAAIGSKDISMGADVRLNIISASFSKCNAGITFNKPNFSTTLMLADKGEALKASYIHYVDRPDGLIVVAELAHGLSSSENRFTIGTSQSIDPKTVLKTRFSDDGSSPYYV